jgi:hypothetical protein
MVLGSFYSGLGLKEVEYLLLGFFSMLFDGCGGGSSWETVKLCHQRLPGQRCVVGRCKQVMWIGLRGPPSKVALGFQEKPGVHAKNS